MHEPLNACTNANHCCSVFTDSPFQSYALVPSLLTRAIILIAPPNYIGWVTLKNSTPNLLLCPVCHFSFQKVHTSAPFATNVHPDAHFCPACTEVSFEADFCMAVKTTDHKVLGCDLGQGLFPNTYDLDHQFFRRVLYELSCVCQISEAHSHKILHINLLKESLQHLNSQLQDLHFLILHCLNEQALTASSGTKPKESSFLVSTIKNILHVDLSVRSHRVLLKVSKLII